MNWDDLELNDWRGSYSAVSFRRITMSRHAAGELAGGV